MADLPPPQPVVTQEIRIVDADGKPRLVLSAKDGAPVILLLRKDGGTGATFRLDADGRPAVTLANPNPAWPYAKLEVDDKGAHVLFDRPGGASSYLFLNNAGRSGVVLIDPAGRRRLDATVTPDGASRIERFGDDGKPIR